MVEGGTLRWSSGEGVGESVDRILLPALPQQLIQLLLFDPYLSLSQP